MPLVQYFDGLGWKNKISTKFGIRSIPAMWLIDKNGNLVDKTARMDWMERWSDYLLSDFCNLLLILRPIY